jgi:hypothetical protein
MICDGQGCEVLAGSNHNTDIEITEPGTEVLNLSSDVCAV